MLIVIEVLETAQENAKSAELQIRFPNSAAIAAESRGHGDLSSGMRDHKEVLFTARNRGNYQYCMRDVLKPEFEHLEEEFVSTLHTRRGRLRVESRFKPDAVTNECFGSPLDCGDVPLPARRAEL